MATSALSARSAAVTMSRLRPGSAGVSSSATERRLPGAVLDEAVQAGLPVIGGEPAGEVPPLDLQAVVQVHVLARVDGLLGRAQGQRGAGHVTARQALGRL